MRSVKGVVCHWTATPDTVRPSDPYPSLSIVRDGRTGLPGPLAQLGLRRDGAVLVIAAGLSYHAGEGYWPGIGANGNADTIGVEAEEGGDGDWTLEMLDAYPRLALGLHLHYRFPLSNVIGHNEWAPRRKVDISRWPDGMAGFRARVRNLLAAPAVPDVPEEDDDMVKFLKGDSTARDSDGVPYGHRVFKVEWSGDFAATAVRTWIRSPQDPGYAAFLATGGKVHQVPQHVLDAIPDKTTAK
jgi:hypothetical protein